MNPVTAAIRQAIPAGGAIPFARFMELALYHPDAGYYEREATNVGRGGDFFTSVSVGSVFGELLAHRFAGWLEALPGAGQLVEAGAHDGRLAADVLGWFQRWRPALFTRLEYWIMEPSPRRRAWQSAALREWADHVRWYDGWTALPATGIRGVIFANELLDALPVRRFGWDAAAKTWFEWGVGCTGEGFHWQQLPPAHHVSLSELPPALLAVLPDGYVAEICPAAGAWWQAAAAALRQGKLVTVDFGHLPGDRFRPERTRGTVRAYRHHQVSDDLLASPGEQDLTADVDWGAVQTAGEQAGLKTDGLWRQEQFLTRIVAEIEQSPAGFAPWTPARLRQLRTLLHPEHLGRAFRVLQQSRG